MPVCRHLYAWCENKLLRFQEKMFTQKLFMLEIMVTTYDKIVRPFNRDATAWMVRRQRCRNAGKIFSPSHGFLARYDALESIRLRVRERLGLAKSARRLTSDGKTTAVTNRTSLALASIPTRSAAQSVCICSALFSIFAHCV